MKGILLDRIQLHLDERDLAYVVDEEAGRVQLSVRVENGGLLVWLHAEDDFLHISIRNNLYAPEDRRAACAELVCRRNWTLKFGRFDLDFSDGEVVYEASVPLDELPSEEILNRALGMALTASDRFIPVFGRVAFGDVSPEEALTFDDGFELLMRRLMGE